MKPVRKMRWHSRSVAADVRPRAFTLNELLVVLVLVLILGLLATALPRMYTGPRNSGVVRCMNNLKQVGLAFTLWANDNGSKFPMSVSTTNGGTLELVRAGTAFPHFQIVSNELNTPKILVCPLDASRNAATNFTTDFCDARLSYFVGVDADPANPRGLLTGDRNLSFNGQTGLLGLATLASNAPAAWVATNLHKTLGVVGFADGSAQRITTAQLRQALAASGTTNRLAIP